MAETTITFSGTSIGGIEGEVTGILAITHPGEPTPPPPPPSSGRIRLTSDLTVYVREDGSDTNTGLENTAASAFATIQKAVDVIAKEYDLNGFKVVVQVADRTTGSYARVKLPKLVGAMHSDAATLRGNLTNPENVPIHSESASYHTCVNITGGGNTWNVEGFKFTTSNALGVYGDAFGVFEHGTLYFKNVEFGATPLGSHIMAQYNSVVFAQGNYKISGGGNCHLNIQTATFDGVTRTVTLVGTPTWTSGYAFADYSAMIYVLSASYVGSASGPRFQSHRNSCVRYNGLTLPGSSAGVTSTGGVAV